MTSAPLNLADALQFILAGNATFTIVSTKTGTRFTYRVKLSDAMPGSFVSVLSGPDNTADYRYLGMIFANSGKPSFRLTKASRSKGISDDTPSVKAITWTLTRLVLNLAPGVEIWHEGTCGCCGRELTVPESIASGFGPVCAKRMAA
jgi:hypothetical protein